MSRVILNLFAQMADVDIDRLLVIRIEKPDAYDLVVVELHSTWQGRICWVQVDQCAARRQRAAILDQGDSQAVLALLDDPRWGNDVNTDPDAV